MKSLFVMDPLDRIVVQGDSTYATMRECSDRGWPVWMCVPDDLFSEDGRALARVTPVRTTDAPPFFHTEAPQTLDLAEFDAVWMRKDPPFNMRYIFSTYLLDMAARDTVVVNGPAGLKLFNEKMWVQQQWPEFQPPTRISNDPDRLRAFVEAQPDRAVLKPWDGNGGRGVVVTHGADPNLGALIELLSQEGREYVIAQRYLSRVVEGDKRVLLFDGDAVGAMMRVPSDRDHRANMHVGATVERTELTERDREICAALRPLLRKWDMTFVGIDIIDGHLTEVNVTSPTGIRELNRLYDLRLEADLVDRVQRRVEERRQ